MISEIKLLSFGKFRNTGFPLGRLTVFQGPNEAGKTTIFDALFDALCRPKASGRYGKIMQFRYGTMRESELIWDADPYEINENDFMDICSISALREAPRFEAADGWMAQIRNQLFAGGINPGLVLERLETMASRKGSLKHNRELKELTARKHEIEQQLAEFEYKRNESLQSLEQAQKDESEISRLHGELTEVETRKKKLESMVKQYHAISKREGLRNWLLDLQKEEELRKSRNQMQVPQESDFPGIQNLQSALHKSEQELLLSRELLSGLEDDLAQEQKKLGNLRIDEVAASQRSAVAESLLTRVQEILPTLSRIEESSERTRNGLASTGLILISVAILLGLGTAAASALVQQSVWRLPLLFGGISLSIISAALLVFQLYRKKNLQSNTQKKVLELQAKLQDFHREAAIALKLELNPGQIESMSNSGLKQATLNLISGLESLKTGELKLQQQIENCEEQIQRTENRIQDVRIRIETATSQKIELSGNLESVLEKYGVKSIRELENAFQSDKRSREQLQEIESRLEKARYHFDIDNNELLKIEINRQLDSLYQQIEEEDPGELQRRKTEQKLKDSVSQAQELQHKLQQLQISFEKNRTSYESRFSSLPGRFLELETELQMVNRNISELELQRTAAAAAAEIIQELHSDTGEQLGQLSAQVSDWFGDILGVSRSVDFQGFEHSQIRIQDARGEARAVEQLSSGTRDAFYLAARLAMVAESDLPEGIIILDDPCVYLDPERSRQAVRILFRFLEKTRHQVLFFTKDTELASEIITAASEINGLSMQSHCLSRT
ncbi:ATP-binding protein [Spirochaeta dissipatitropha]